MRVLEVDGVRKSYGNTVALRGVSLSLEEGYLVGLVGPNGAGRTRCPRGSIRGGM